ncbi:MAG: DUF166 domain-containing protein [Desulfobulbaceae bacterium]|nr:DUF166 domain-containing protein [Desulfobulbaceae bacterium]
MEKIIIFQQAGSGNAKIDGIKQYSRGIAITQIFDLPSGLPDFIEEPEPYFQEDFNGDLVISFLTHPDLLHHLALLCKTKNIPLIASGKKCAEAITPVTCCSLGKLAGLGTYGEQFGIPEYEVEVTDGKISDIRVKRGASCGATWKLIPRLIGLSPEEALERVAREAQYLCPTDPSKFDPITGKSALHIAGNVHAKALKKALS